MLKSALFVASAALVAAQSSSQPCAAAASALARASSSQGIPAQVAFDCLNSVPVDSSGNQKLIDELKQVWQFQSELVWFKNPGDEWEYGSLDIIGELDRIKNSLGSFKSEYEVQLAIANITVRTGNFHFNYAPDILQVFQFQRPINVASVSSDGKQLPKLYVHDDIAPLASGSRRVSAIEQINDQDAYEYLKSTWFSQYIDSDGRMNNMFSKGDTDQQGAFAVQDRYDGNSTTIKWTNGSTATIRNIATSDLSFTGVSDGKSFFSKFCTGLTGASTSSADTREEKDPGLVSPRRLGRIPTIPLNDYHTRNKRQTINPSTYPKPITVGTSGVVAGYFLTGQGYEDVAVLKIISFSNPSQSGETSFNNEFQNTVKTFLSECEKEKKTKLIIDLRENGGGNTNLLLDAFMQLFPSLDPFSGQRYRASDAWLKIGEAVNEIRGSADLSRKYRSVMGESMENTNVYRYWAYWHFRKADGTNFADWDEFNGPLLLNSDNLTTTMRYNVSLNSTFSFFSSNNFSVLQRRPRLHLSQWLQLREWNASLALRLQKRNHVHRRPLRLFLLLLSRRTEKYRRRPCRHRRRPSREQTHPNRHGLQRWRSHSYVHLSPIRQQSP
jgi:hypothetical protein